jgi:hypothetical protein
VAFRATSVVSILFGRSHGQAGLNFNDPERSRFFEAPILKRGSRMIQQISEDLLWNQIVAKAWCDEALMKRLLSNPRSVVAEHGMQVPESVEVKITEGDEVKVMDDTDAVRRFILPFSPPDDLTDEDLVGETVAWCGCACGACGRCVACAACGRCGRCGCRCW